MSPTERSTTKLMSLLTLNEREATKRTSRLRKSDIGRVRVIGYSTDLPQDDVVNALTKKFSPCGEITDVCVNVLSDNNLLDDFGFIYFLGGEASVEKALKLSGTDFGGWSVIVVPYPFPEDADWDPVVIVQGFDTSLGKRDIKKMLFDHFSSCGEITNIHVRESIDTARVSLYGQGAEDKVLALDGSYMGGNKILVKHFTTKGLYTVHPRHRYTGWPK